MKTWFALYKKELYALTFFALVVSLIMLGWVIFLWYKAPHWPEGLAFGLTFIPFSFYPLLMLWLGYSSFRQEWKDETSYFMLSIPRPGWQLNLSKLVAGVTFYAGIILLNILVIYFFHLDFIKLILGESPELLGETGRWVAGMIGQGLLYYLLLGVIVYVVSQFSQLISQFYSRFRGLISIVVFILSYYLIYRGGSILAPLFKWVPDLSIWIPGGEFNPAGRVLLTVDLAPLIVSALIIIAIFFSGSRILERHLEV